MLYYYQYDPIVKYFLISRNNTPVLLGRVTSEGATFVDTNMHTMRFVHPWEAVLQQDLYLCRSCKGWLRRQQEVCRATQWTTKGFLE
jgi:hypothetical protein